MNWRSAWTSSRVCWRRQKELRRMPAGRHGHKIREYKRRIDALLEAERERRNPPPPPPLPISEEHAAMRERVERAWGAVLKLIPEEGARRARVGRGAQANPGGHRLRRG